MHTSHLRFTLCLMSLLTILVGLGAAADVPGESGERPHQGGEPTTVEVVFFLIDVTEINGAAQSFTADLFVKLRWRDRRLASPAGARRLAVDEVWNPRLQIMNQRGVETTFPELVDVSADGTVEYRQRYVGEFSSRLDLHDFPMDHHTLGFHFVVPGYGRDGVELVAPHDEPAAMTSPSLSIVDWEITNFGGRPGDFEPVPGGPSIAGIAAEFQARRYLGFYMSKAVLSVAIIVLMSWTVFWIAPKNIAPRMSVSVTAMLTLIAYRFLLGGLLPPLSYLTRMDHFLLGSTFLVFMTIVEVAAASRYHDSDRPEKALAMDRISRWAFPVAFIALLLVSFWVF